MLRSFADALNTSVGRKALMALTGLLLVLYLILHLAGNLTLFADAEGTAFDAYAAKIKGFGALVYVAEVGLALLFIAHIVLGIRLSMQNREARRHRYHVRATHGQQTVASSSMIVTGLIIGGFVVKHVIDFRLDPGFVEAPAGLVMRTLAEPMTAVIYILSMVVLTLHLSHGFRSAFQSLGVNHPRWNPILEKGGLALALILGLGFLAFPVYFLLFWNGGSA